MPTQPPDSKELLRIGDLARLTGKTVRALHFYEELEILRPRERTRGGFRLYAPESVTRVWLIEKLQILGLSLPEIRELLLQWEESQSGEQAAQQILLRLTDKQQALREEIARLQGLEQELAVTVEYLKHCATGCSRGGAPAQCSSCKQAAESGPPSLVSGLYPS